MEHYSMMFRLTTGETLPVTMANNVTDQCWVMSMLLQKRGLRVGRTWSFGYNTRISGDDEGGTAATLLTLKASKELELRNGSQKVLFILFRMKITTNNRIWNALHSFSSTDIIRNLLCTDSELVKDSYKTGLSDAPFCCLGDILLFGNVDRTASDIDEIYMDYSVEKLVECFGSPSGWKQSFNSMTKLLQDCVSRNRIFDTGTVSEKQRVNEAEVVRGEFKSLALSVRRCFSTLCTHMPMSFILEHNLKTMVSLVALLNAFETLLFRDNLVSSHVNMDSEMLLYSGTECLSLLFSDNFRKSFSKLRSSETKHLVLLLLSKLSNGWRPKRSSCESPFDILKQFKVGELYIISSTDLVKESWYIQALKVWDILPFHEVPKLIKCLDNILGMYTQDYLNHCRAKCTEGNLEVPMSWPASSEIVRYKGLGSSKSGEANAEAFDSMDLVGKSKVRVSLLLMKFYSLASGAVSNLPSACDGSDLGIPFQLTGQEQEIVRFNKSTFVLGRSGTGKTTVLTMKLFQNEQLFHLASQGFHEVRSDSSTKFRWKFEVTEDHKEAKGDVLRQLFVTISPKLCYAVKQHVSVDKSSSVHTDDIDDIGTFLVIADSFVDIPSNSYPLVITTKEVNYERFRSSYWPHFNSLLTKRLDSSIVYTEIISVIKGGLHGVKAQDKRMGQQDYISLSEDRKSALSIDKREMIYNIFLQYEKRKMENGEFDLADLVIDLHRRLKDKSYEGEEMDFVYIDEVQDLSMGQISLFKYICRNVDEGFVFCGDTAQTIAKGIDFRFEDIRRLFYEEFVLRSRIGLTHRRTDKGLISDIFHLCQNFRTHAGVLKLANSVINLIYHFFLFAIDVLCPETSLLCGTCCTIYMENFEGSKLEKAGECFMLAKCYLRAAEVNARAGLYAKSLYACIDGGELFDIGLQYIQDWDQKEDLHAQKEEEMGRVVLDFLQRDMNCLDELLSLEREWENFQKAANVAKLKGDRLLEADLSEMAGFF
ncbi:hypothetical protein RJ639_044890 [Escallonia herrerae]|uniref:UvrD-like helicase ATP-binding domain-containing protein n=1 Tax=Escallonia herrerae TaxID=1293975 RepID=A0AA89B7B5_9ASTE|nr:hypothetical protein RJ639_044890 [Escallonia herrerae]